MISDFPADRPLSPAILTVPASWIYGWAAGVYHRRWDQKSAFRPQIPVISVGNLTVGGSGKTPTVISLAQILCEIDPRLREQNAIAVLSRGYGRRKSNNIIRVASDTQWRDCGDEPKLISGALPFAAVLVHENRRKTADFAAKELNSRVILLDDGFQHRPLHRDLNLLLVDGRQPLGNGRLLPAGPLREPPEPALKRADVIIGVGDSADAAASLAGMAEKAFLHVKPVLEDLPVAENSCAFAFCGIARPQRFIQMLEKKSIEVVGEKFFPDHHPFTGIDLRQVEDEARTAGADFIVTTEKDCVRVGKWSGSLPLHAPRLVMEFVDKNKITDLLKAVL